MHLYFHFPTTTEENYYLKYLLVQEILTPRTSSLLRRFPASHGISSYGQLWSKVLCDHGPSNMRDEKRPNESTNLLRMLLSHREKLCNEPRDRVYAVLGLLAAHERSQFPVDYTVSVREIFTNVVDYLLRTTQRLDVICATIHFPLHPNRFSLPSWVSRSFNRGTSIHLNDFAIRECLKCPSCNVDTQSKP